MKLWKEADRKRLFCSNMSTLLSMIVAIPSYQKTKAGICCKRENSELSLVVLFFRLINVILKGKSKTKIPFPALWPELMLVLFITSKTLLVGNTFCVA